MLRPVPARLWARCGWPYWPCLDSLGGHLGRSRQEPGRALQEILPRLALQASLRSTPILDTHLAEAVGGVPCRVRGEVGVQD